jgi:hypothetical protein
MRHAVCNIGLAFISADWFFDMICSRVMNCEPVIVNDHDDADDDDSTVTIFAVLDAVGRGAISKSYEVPKDLESSGFQQTNPVDVRKMFG